MLAELRLPIKLVAPLVPPGPESAREVMQTMLVGITHGTMHLMYLLGDNTYGFADSGFSCGHFLFEAVSAHGIHTGIRSSLRRSDFSAHHGQRMLIA